MKISFLDGVNRLSQPLATELERQGVEVSTYATKDCDFFWNASVANYERYQRYSRSMPHVKTINYVWDFYKWAWENKREGEWYDWKGYAGYLSESHELWFPSKAAEKRVKEHLKVSTHVIHTAIPVEDHPRDTSKKYVLNSLREIPDPNWGLTRRACLNQNLPYEGSEHKLPWPEWKAKLANATINVAENYEASTGGLAIIEGLWNGVPSLISNSAYMGGGEYAKEFGTYFQWDKVGEFERKLVELFENPPTFSRSDVREFINDNYSYEVMAKKVIDRMEQLLWKSETS